MSDTAALVNRFQDSAPFTRNDSTFATIGFLPAELLLEIFGHCVANHPISPLTLRKVSWLWQKLIDTSPYLWRTVSLSDADPDCNVSEPQALLWRRKCQPQKFDVELNLQDTDHILPLLSPLLSSIDRWRTFRLRGKREEEIRVDDLNITSDCLTHLHVFLHDSEQDEFDEDEPRISISPTSPDQSISFSLSVWVSRIPTTGINPPLRFVHVSIAEDGQIGPHTQPKFILEFLTSCPELESFYLSGWPHDDAVIRPLPIVNLPNLVSLHLKSTCFARALLSSLNTPRLQNLLLSHLNVDFQLPTESPEEGDSEDEARDFSQSPWSDQATGMGLRKLIQRCHPPIRILEMDFCDMRTKDFRYVFDRLHLLQDFHIVASDMSDKVIAMLRPVKEENGVRVRLPRLQKLRLINCQQLSGKAITEAIAARVKWTDTVYPDYTLSEVIISGCEGVSPLDREALSTELGPRLRT
uniref:F-box domain-containing protein n=1 Tax=Psilocybe cubensis TaxID=181762 RepID=A0A8H7XP19_PSICU